MILLCILQCKILKMCLEILDISTNMQLCNYAWYALICSVATRSAKIFDTIKFQKLCYTLLCEFSRPLLWGQIWMIGWRKNYASFLENLYWLIYLTDFPLNRRKPHTVGCGDILQFLLFFCWYNCNMFSTHSKQHFFQMIFGSNSKSPLSCLNCWAIYLIFFLQVISS